MSVQRALRCCIYLLQKSDGHQLLSVYQLSAITVVSVHIYLDSAFVRVVVPLRLRSFCSPIDLAQSSPILFPSKAESGLNTPTHPSLHNPYNPYSVTRCPAKPMFIMPEIPNDLPNPFFFDGSTSAPPMLSPEFFDSYQCASSEDCQPAPPPTSNTPQSKTYFSLPRSYPDSNQHAQTNMATPSVEFSSMTPSATCSSRQPSEFNNDDPRSSSSSCIQSTTDSSPVCPKFPFRQASSGSPYSASGFDLMGALARVVTRPHPQVKVGPVDCSAALVVVDARQNDLPIIFASPSFSLLTGYENSEIIGQNCRFLQYPSRTTRTKRCTVESKDSKSASFQIRSHIQAGREIQSSIVNYRKDGQAFVNLVTVIPIAWDESGISHFVGFQVDLVSLTNKQGVPPSPKTHSLLLQTCKLNTYKAVTGVTSHQSPISSPKQQKAVSSPSLDSLHDGSRSGFGDLVTSPFFYQDILNESRDLVLAISLKGTLLYVSPSCEHILGYREEMLVNQNISKICHNGDETGILRKLKTIGSEPHTPIDLVFRALDSRGQHFWMESQGQLHFEAGKGRKYLVVVGRPRQIGPLPWSAIRSVGGLGENEFWMKLSTDGLCLFATLPVREILSFEPCEMVGKSLTQLSSQEEHGSIIKAIRSAYEGNDVVTLMCFLKDRTGTPVEVVGNFYPPHYSSGPRACGMPLPSSKLSNPPRIIFCQINSMSSSKQRVGTNQFKNPVVPLCSQSALEDHIVPSTIMKADPPNQLSTPEVSSGQPSTFSLIPETIGSNSDDDLFCRLGTTRDTPWNCEYSQLKQQNKKLRLQLSQKGPSGGKFVSTRVKNIHLGRKSANTPYRSFTGHRQTYAQKLADSAITRDPSTSYNDDAILFQTTTLFGDPNLEKTFNRFYSPT